MTIQTTVKTEEKRGEMLYRDEIWEMEGNPPTPIKAAYTLAGDYIGDHESADFLASRGIVPELKRADSKVCSIGFSEKEQKWYGWSHRAICGFAVGDVAEDGDCVCESGAATRIPVGFKAETFDDAKLMAVAFADSVS